MCDDHNNDKANEPRRRQRLREPLLFEAFEQTADRSLQTASTSVRVGIIGEYAR